MKRKDYLFTSESVTEGHPDKLADQISDGILDTVLESDPQGRVACEALVTTGLVVVAGEITTACYVDIPKVVREIIKLTGYTEPRYGFCYQSCGVITSIQEQTSDIAMGVDTGGAGDQGMMFGYAVDETEELMPLPISLAHRLTKRLAYVRKEKLLDYIRPDGKSQVTVQYEDHKPSKVVAVVVSAHHIPGVDVKRLRADIEEVVIRATIPEKLLDKDARFFINPTGLFETGGPEADTGLTGRKIIMDTYGGVGSHGGGCFSGKDPTKVDRSASYIARYIAKNVVAGGLSKECEVQIAYAIGVAKPVSIMVNTHGTGKVPDDKIEKLIEKHFDLTPGGIIETLNLRRPIYRKTAAYGHFGREEENFTWERTDKAELLRTEAGLPDHC